VAVERADEEVSNAENDIEFSVSGAGSLAGVANGSPASHESNVHRVALHSTALRWY